MTLIGNSGSGASRAVAGYLLLCVLCLLAGACSQESVAPAETKATPANVSVAATPNTEIEVKPVDTKPAGKEIVVAEGPALKSITPAEGTIFVGILNNWAADVPKPDYPASADAKKASGSVTIEVMVNEKGQVVASSAVGGPQPLWSAAAAAARETRFDPPLKDGKPVKIAGLLIFDFEK